MFRNDFLFWDLRMNKQPKLTGLYPLSIKPVRVGVYVVEFSYSRKRHFARWNGKFWCAASYERDVAAEEKRRSFAVYDLYFAGWRGQVKP